MNSKKADVVISGLFKKFCLPYKSRKPDYKLKNILLAKKIIGHNQSQKELIRFFKQ